ncbi:MAG: M14 family metallopeptidase [Mycobacteriales bacterium]
MTAPPGAGAAAAADDQVLAAFGSYRAARADFLARAGALGARLHAYRHPRLPELGTDVAVLGPRHPECVLLVVSGTHGVEGHAGSAIQRRQLPELATAGCGVVLVHALNPYGFEHDRRVNEDNVDVNRNFQPFPDVPDNPDYRLVHRLLVPADWEGPAHRQAQQDLLAAVSALGLERIQTAVTGGQHEFADGLFFGGTAPTWSNRTLRRIVREHVAGARHVAYVDLHTGLGERAAGETIFRGGDDAGAFARAVAWYGPQVTSSEAGTSSSTPIGGNTARGVLGELPAGTVVTAITLEFGTREGIVVLAALQGDNWFAQAGGRADPRYARVREAMLDAFAPDDDGWRRQVLRRGAEVLRQARAGLRAGLDAAVGAD